MVNLSQIEGCVYYPTRLSLLNLAKHQNEREERESLYTHPQKK